MKLTVLCENTTCCEAVRPEHGLSLLLETGEKRILFDMGQTRAYLENAEALGIDLSSVDLAVLSHGHYDHGGGMATFLEVNPSAPIYLHPRAFDPHYHGREKYIGLDPALQGHPRLCVTADTYRIAPGLTLYSCNQSMYKYPVHNFGLQVLAGESPETGILTEDSFLHEQYLLIEENSRRILVSGCSHKGILNIMDWFAPDILIGGFHFVKWDPQTKIGRAQLEQAAETLLRYPTVYYTGHCTGKEQFAFLKERMGERLHSISAGQQLIIPSDN